MNTTQSQFYGYNVEIDTQTNDNFLIDVNENYRDHFLKSKPGIISLPYLFQKFLDKDYSRFYAAPKMRYNLKHMERGFYPNNLMKDIDKAEMHYQKLNEMFKLEI